MFFFWVCVFSLLTIITDKFKESNSMTSTALILLFHQGFTAINREFTDKKLSRLSSNYSNCLHYNIRIHFTIICTHMRGKVWVFHATLLELKRRDSPDERKRWILMWLADVAQPRRFTSEVESFQIRLKARASVHVSQARILKKRLRTGNKSVQ